MFLGVVEELPVVGRHTMKVLPERDFVVNSVNKTINEIPTPVYTFLSNPRESAWIDFIFTDENLFSKCRYKSSVLVKRKIDLKNERLGRTILLVTIGSDQFVLKCIGNNDKTHESGVIRTPTQDEAFNFEKMPNLFKKIFVGKYAHGRLWLGDSSVSERNSYNCEVIFMEQLYDESISIEMTRRVRSGDDIMYSWWSHAISMLLTIHKNWICTWRQFII